MFCSEGKTVDDVKQRLHKLKLVADKKKRKSKSGYSLSA